MKRVLLTLSFDGTAYHGWQVQENAVTVQETLQNGLESLLGVRPSVTGCSRTDAGVHARQFCCHLDCDDAIPKEAFLRGLNSILPKDIAVTDYREVASDFHARYHCKGKNYRYKMYVGAIHDPFLKNYALRLDQPLDLERCQQFCAGLVGTHDFAPFSSAGRSVTDTVRTVSACNIIENKRGFELSVSADGFLYNMVRIIVGTAIAVSQGRRSPNCAKEIFALGKRELAGETAPPQGLYLNQVFYDLR
ncbi:MAG: tRNA pseudouridine(38-40) synthase TruA [Clostridia bacterium]|nr:tRNA pseudouridine(38-40) synthase TruA [Clostridia bacterium]